MNFEILEVSNADYVKTKGYPAYVQVKTNESIIEMLKE